MRERLLELIACPRCEAELLTENAAWRAGQIETGELVCKEGHRYPIRRFVPRFVSDDGYADAFALEWNAFRTAHLERFTGLGYLDDQFREFLDFPVEALAGKRVLDAGCGLGRFSEVALNHGGEVVGVDLSGAIDAAFENLGDRPGFHCVQADVFELPFRTETFDFVYSWGVLHHTPDPPAAFRRLPPLVRPGGKLMVFVYAKYNKAYLAVTEFYRRFTKRLPKRLLLRLCYLAVPLYYVGKIPVIGPLVTRLLLPVSVRPPTHRWRVGNTFDLYSPEYAFTYDHVEVHRWFEAAGLERIRPVAPDSGVSYIGTKPQLGDIDWSEAVRADEGRARPRGRGAAARR